MTIEAAIARPGTHADQLAGAAAGGDSRIV
jgi:hypothetical protein